MNVLKSSKQKQNIKFDETQIKYLVEMDFSDSDIEDDPYQSVF